MPRARKQRDSLYKKKKRFVHYTSAEAALGIINSKRIWMRNTNCMADYLEVQHGHEILVRFFSDAAKKKAFVDALDISVPGAANEAIKLFDQWWDDIRFSSYITSLSEHEDKEDQHGRLSMWRAFGGNAARVAIIFRIPGIARGAEALNLLFSPVTYLTEKEMQNQMTRVTKSIRDNKVFLQSVDRQFIVGSVFHMLVTGVACLKHEGFREEREWRAVYSPNRNPSNLMKSSIKVIGGVPQLVYELPLDETVSKSLADLDFARLFDRLIIGPTQYAQPIYSAFVEALTRAGVPDADKLVVASGIPIRT